MQVNDIGPGPFSDRDIQWMKEALAEALKSFDVHETPIGAVIVKDGRIIARGCNLRNTSKSSLAHAEISAIEQACREVGDWRLEGCTMYVTLEPCPMCAGALVQSRIDRVVIGAMNPKAGCAGSIMNLLEDKRFNHQVRVDRGCLAEESAALLKRFFRDLRIAKNQTGYKGPLPSDSPDQDKDQEGSEQGILAEG
jgi:tRNA(adenine34) deaminase